MARLSLDARDVVLLRHVAAAEGQSQQALAEALQIPASRMVALVDGLERNGLLERRAVHGDRRVRALYLTRQGRRLLGRVMQVSAEHEAELCAGLDRSEREQLIALLSRLAAEQGLATGVHPGVAGEPMEGGASGHGTAQADESPKAEPPTGAPGQTKTRRRGQR